MKYVLYPVGLVLAGAIFLGLCVGANVGFAIAWHYALGLKAAEANIAGQLTLAFVVMALGGVIFARDAK